MSSPSEMRLRVVYIGTRGAFSLPPLEALLAAHADVRAVIVPAAPEQAESLAPLPPPRRAAHSLIPMISSFVEETVVHTAWQRGIPVFAVRRFGAALQAHCAALQPDVICVACFPRRLPGWLLDLPTHGALNVHPSLLPAYRGPAPLFWTFRDGQQATGVTVHFMDESFDTGDIAAHASLTLPDGISGLAADQLCATLGGQLLVEALDQLQRGMLQRRSQPPGGSQQPWPAAADFVISTDWSARRAFNFICGTTEWGEFYTVEAGGEQLQIAAALAYDEHAQLDAPFVRAGDEIEIQFSPGVLRAQVD